MTYNRVFINLSLRLYYIQYHLPKLISGTRDGQATAVAKVLQEWDIVNRVCAMCFDMTSTNTGHRNGSCVLLEQKLENDLLYLACRHHLLELYLLVFSRKAPDVAVFKRFQLTWN